MDATFDISAEVPKAQVDAFVGAMSRYQSELGNGQAVAVRRGVIHLIKSLRARTAKAKRQAPMSDVRKYDGNGPHYITPKGRRQTAQHRFTVRRRGGRDEVFRVVPAASRADARKRAGQYTRWGLAKKSWGWFMQSLFNRANPEGKNPKARIRPGMTEGYLHEIVTGKNPRIEVLIVNKLGYIRSALPDNALADSIRSATNSINAQFRKKEVEARGDLK